MSDNGAQDTGSDQVDTGSVDALPASGQEHPAEGASPATVPTRISGTWVGIIIGALVLVLLLVFVLQNTESVKVSFFAANGHIPLGVALLFAAVGGVLLAAVAASLRILQIRRRLSRAPGQAAEPTLPATPTLAVSELAEQPAKGPEEMHT